MVDFSLCNMTSETSGTEQLGACFCYCYCYCWCDCYCYCWCWCETECELDGVLNPGLDQVLDRTMVTTHSNVKSSGYDLTLGTTYNFARGL